MNNQKTLRIRNGRINKTGPSRLWRIWTLRTWRAGRRRNRRSRSKISHQTFWLRWSSFNLFQGHASQTWIAASNCRLRLWASLRRAVEMHPRSNSRRWRALLSRLRNGKDSRIRSDRPTMLGRGPRSMLCYHPLSRERTCLPDQGRIRSSIQVHENNSYRSHFWRSTDPVIDQTPQRKHATAHHSRHSRKNSGSSQRQVTQPRKLEDVHSWRMWQGSWKRQEVHR